MGSTEAEAVSRAFDAFERGWEAEFGDGIPLPTFSPATIRDFRVTSRAIRVDDAAITDLNGESVIGTEGPSAAQKMWCGCMSSGVARGHWAARTIPVSRPYRPAGSS